MLSKILFVFFLICCNVLNADEENWIYGQNVTFSPAADEFIYFNYGKTKASKIWRIFSIKEDKDLDTIIYNIDTYPVWSAIGSIVAYPDKNKIILISPSGKNEFTGSANNINLISFAPDDKKIVYSDFEKIYILDLETKKNSFLAYGKKPVWTEKGIIYKDDNNFVYVFGTAGGEKLILSDIDEFTVSKDSKLIIGTGLEFQGFVTYNLETSETNFIAITNSIQGYDTSPDGRYLIFSLANSGIWIRDMDTGLSYKILQNGIFPKWSWTGNYITYEYNKKIFIKETKEFLSSIKSKKLYKINIGSSVGLKLGDILQVYEEKIDPFTDKVTGYDQTHPKTKVKIISIFPDYSYVDKVSDDATELEINDVVFSQKVNKFGVICPWP